MLINYWIKIFLASPPARPARPPASPTPVRPPPPSLSGSPFPGRREDKDDLKTSEKDVSLSKSDLNEEDPWARFNQMSAQVSNAVKNTQEQLKNLSENSTVDTIQDESYLAQIG